jgi:hypothetical protein
MPDQSDKHFLTAFMRTARHFTALAPKSMRDPQAFDLVERRAAEILENPPIDLHHQVMEHIGELRREEGGIFGGHNSELLEELGDYPQARRVFYAVIAACHDLGPELESRQMHHPPGGELLEDREM